MSDPKIKQLQTDLATLGYDPGPIDGLMGDKTRAALLRYAGNGVGAGEVLADPSALHAKAEAKRATVPALPVGYIDLVDRCTILDWRKCSVCHKDSDECKHPGGPLPRAWSQIKGVTLHQTGCPMSSRPERWLNLKAHYGITAEGTIYRIHSETTFGWHAQGLSHHEIGIEIMGVFCGVENDPSTRPGCPASWGTNSITEAQIQSTRALIRYLHALVAHHGGALTDIHSHRQGAPRKDPKNCRPPDPGSKAWKQVALVMMAELGLSDGGPGWISGTGEPNPDEWTGQPNGIPYRTK